MGIRNIVEQKSPWFMREINNYLMEGSVKKPAVGRFRPSDFVELPENTCFRELQYTYMGFAAVDEFDLASIRRMMAGSAHHDMWESVFKEAIHNTQPGKLIEIRGDNVFEIDLKTFKRSLYRVDNGANYPFIRMKCDWCIQKNVDSELEIVEWKTGRWKKPAEKHIVQWNMYSVGLNARKGWIVIENREDADPQPYPMERNDALIETLFVGLRNIEQHAKDKSMIAKDERCVNGEWKPRYCKQYSLCFSEKGDNPW